MNKVIFFLLATMICGLAYVQTHSSTICATPVRCEVWAGRVQQQEFAPLAEIGFDVRCDESGTYYRATAEHPTTAQLTEAKRVHNALLRAGFSSTLELTSADRLVIPEGARVTDRFRDGSTECISFIWRGARYQAAYSPGETILGTPAISTGY